MFTGLSSLSKWTYCYERFITLKKKCKWYEFWRKRIIQREIDWVYPLMLAEKRFFKDLKTNQ